ncbi:MAG: arsenic metallochaperone ArsD family protein [Candidatus Desulforudis sp.]|nr:arsenic metallochaperone ArsD family protein [Desulforudis sp.]
MQRSIEIFDPSMCCSSGLCGPTIDPTLMEVSETVTRLRKEHPDLTIDRHMFGRAFEPFTRTSVVMDLIKERGLGVLPITVLDGRTVVAAGRYPSYDELKQALKR